VVLSGSVGLSAQAYSIFRALRNNWRDYCLPRPWYTWTEQRLLASLGIGGLYCGDMNTTLA
jgi:hypothetical protein